jgi:hypothetical protein
MPMKLPKIDFEELSWALEDNSGENSYFLDTKTGEVIRISESYGDDELTKADKRRVARGGRRYARIESIPSWESYSIMEGFAGTIEDAGLREKLGIALDGRGAFRRFKNVLLDYPKEREEWFKFHKERMKEHVGEFLEGIKLL